MGAGVTETASDPKTMFVSFSPVICLLPGVAVSPAEICAEKFFATDKGCGTSLSTPKNDGTARDKIGPPDPKKKRWAAGGYAAGL